HPRPGRARAGPAGQGGPPARRWSLRRSRDDSYDVGGAHQLVHRGVRPQSSGGAAADVAAGARPRGLERLGRFAAKRRWIVLAVWLLIAIVLGVGSAGAGKP